MGKNLYLDDVSSNGVSCDVFSNDGLLDLSNPNFVEDMILKEGDSLVMTLESGQGYFTCYGFLVDTDPNINILNILLDISNSSYTVPINKKLIVENTIEDGVSDLTITLGNNQTFNTNTSFPENIQFLPSNTIIQANQNSSEMKYIISGYLIND